MSLYLYSVLEMHNNYDKFNCFFLFVQTKEFEQFLESLFVYI